MSCSSEMHHSSSTHRYIRSTFQPAAFCWMPAFDRSVWNHETSVFFKAETWKKKTLTVADEKRKENMTPWSPFWCVSGFFLINQLTVFTEWKGSSLGWRWPDPPYNQHLSRQLWHGKDTVRYTSTGSRRRIVLRKQKLIPPPVSTECHGEIVAKEGHPV